MRPVWKGHLRFSLVTIPVRVYNAVDAASELSFNLLHKEDYGRVGYEKKCKKCGKTLKTDDMVKGFEYEPDQYVVIEKADFEKVRLKTTRVAEVQGFVDAASVDPVLLERPYYLGPDGTVAGGPYALLVKTLAESGKVAIAKVVIRDREDAVMVAPDAAAAGLVMHVLRAPKDVRAVSDVPGLDEKKPVAAAELKLAGALVEQMSTTLSEIDLADRYEAAVQDVIRAKVEGREVVMIAEDEQRPAVDIMTALRESIDAAKGGRKPMVTAGGKSAVRSTTKSGSKKAEVRDVREGAERAEPGAKGRSAAKGAARPRGRRAG